LGQKIILTEFVGYSELSNMLSAGVFSETKSAILSAYVLCGFANFASVGILIGGIGSIAPNQRATLSAFGMKSLLGGTLAALISAAMIGMMI
jgi:CNT family concentrative nucleoside transporter